MRLRTTARTSRASNEFAMTLIVKEPITRIAPTPSGWLHIGNLCSFLLTRLWADQARARLLLRIDDLDTDRSRDVFIEDIFHQLSWAGISWDLGPKDLETHKEHFSQAWSFEFYQAVLDERVQSHPEHFFVCACSRREKSDGKPCECRGRKIELAKNKSALMLDLRSLKGTSVEITDFNGRTQSHVFEFNADAVPIIRKEGIFSYHWVSLNEDRKHRITHVIRGEDLWSSTLLQVAIERLLFRSEPVFSKAAFLHHDLLKDPDGRKLSKSEESQSLLDLRNHGFSLEHLNRVFADFIGMPVTAEVSRREIENFLALKWNHDQQ
jgi:glutamyl/glutaminyl-tRNA synthetase